MPKKAIIYKERVFYEHDVKSCCKIVDGKKNETLTADSETELLEQMLEHDFDIISNLPASDYIVQGGYLRHPFHLGTFDTFVRTYGERKFRK